MPPNRKGVVDAQQYLFDILWNKAIPAEQKIKEIEEGIKPAFIETIRDPYISQRRGINPYFLMSIRFITRKEQAC